MGRIRLAHLALWVGAALPACSGSLEPSPTGSEKTGSLGLGLTMPGGVVLSSVEYTVSGNAITPITGTIDTSGSAATASVFVGALPQSPAGAPLDYSVSMSATSVDGSTTCTGSASFDVTAGQTVGVTVPLICSAQPTRGNVKVNGEFNNCPIITSMIVAPLQTDLNKTIDVSATASDKDAGDTLAFAWSATAGSFAAANATSTKYTCSTPGDQTLTLTVDDGNGCLSDLAVAVNCVTPYVCGDGTVNPGEECEPPNGLGCNSTCHHVSLECGDNIVAVQGGEQCDPPNGTTCDSLCHSIVCGDGTVSGSEQCEPPSRPGICNATCQNAFECGDGIKAPQEQCEPPSSAGCDQNCQLSPEPCAACTALSCPAASAACDANGAPFCHALLNCIAATHCATGSVRDGAECYCGSVDNDTCFNSFNPAVPQGACKAAFETAAGSNIPLHMGQIFYDLTSPVGAAMQVTSCRLSECNGQCFDNTHCGDGVVDPFHEECDPPDGTTCSPFCQSLLAGPVCGNSVVEAGEQCDPPGVTCSPACQLLGPEPSCGNQLLEAGEECDPPNGTTCGPNCRLTVSPLCGDLIVQAGEECDPPNGITCAPDCHFFVIEPDSCQQCLAAQCPAATQACAAQAPGCDTLLQCIQTSHCARGSSRDGAECYCGPLDNDGCFNSFNPAVPQGVCKGVFESVAGSTIPLQIGQVFFDLTSPVGAAMQTTSCRASNCASQCGDIGP